MRHDTVVSVCQSQVGGGVAHVCTLEAAAGQTRSQRSAEGDVLDCTCR